MVHVIALAGMAAWAGTASAQVSDDVVKVGVLTDMGSLFADATGAGSVEAARMAVEDFGGTVLGRRIEVVAADHQNRADVGSALARRWFDTEGVDVIVDLPTSSVALAVQQVARDKDRISMVSGAGTSDLTGKACSPRGVHWTYDTYALASVLGAALTREGNDTWFFLTADYSFGNALQRDATNKIVSAGGKVLGSVRHPFNASDFGAFLLEAQGSRAKVIGLANAGGDTANSIRQAVEFGITAGDQKLAGLLVYLTDVHGLGLGTAQGLKLAEAFYWDMDAGTRAFAQRFFERRRAMPTMVQAGVYGSVLHYLKGVASAGTDASGPVMDAMRSNPINDFMTQNGYLREDGRVVRDIHLFEVKAPSESRRPWDYYKHIATIRGDLAFRPLSESECPLVVGAK